MDNAARLSYIQWVLNEERKFANHDDHVARPNPLEALVGGASSTPPVTAQRGLAGSPRRRGMVLHAGASTPRRTIQNMERIPPPSWGSGPPSRTAGAGAAPPRTSSTPSKKHATDVPSDVPAQRRRRLLAELDDDTTSFRYSAPCLQSGLGEQLGRGSPMGVPCGVKDERTPITMCGGRLYSEWTGEWGRPMLPHPSTARASSHQPSQRDPTARYPASVPYSQKAISLGLVMRNRGFAP